MLSSVVEHWNRCRLKDPLGVALPEAAGISHHLGHGRHRRSPQSPVSSFGGIFKFLLYCKHFEKTQIQGVKSPFYHSPEMVGSGGGGVILRPSPQRPKKSAASDAQVDRSSLSTQPSSALHTPFQSSAAI